MEPHTYTFAKISPWFFISFSISISFSFSLYLSETEIILSRPLSFNVSLRIYISLHIHLLKYHDVRRSKLLLFYSVPLSLCLYLSAYRCFFLVLFFSVLIHRYENGNGVPSFNIKTINKQNNNKYNELVTCKSTTWVWQKRR